jgi:hypothetical protein
MTAILCLEYAKIYSSKTALHRKYLKFRRIFALETAGLLTQIKGEKVKIRSSSVFTAY